MSRKVTSRREFLTLPLAALLAPLFGRTASAAPDTRNARYGADVTILYGMLTYRLGGAISETVQRPWGRYEVTIVGGGDGISHRIESRGPLPEGGRAAPQARSVF